MESHAKSSAEALATAILTFSSQSSRAACPHNFFCRLRGQLELFSIFLFVCFVFPARALLLASEMASVTLEVKINNQSCKQRKRRGRSWGKQVTKEKPIGTSKVKQKRVTNRVQAEVLMQAANHRLFCRAVHWKRAQSDFSTLSFTARPAGNLFWSFYCGAVQPFPHAHIIFSTFAVSCESG